MFPPTSFLGNLHDVAGGRQRYVKMIQNMYCKNVSNASWIVAVCCSQTFMTLRQAASGKKKQDECNILQAKYFKCLGGCIPSRKKKKKKKNM